MDLRDTFDRVCVISLARRPERLAAFLDGLRDWPFATPQVVEGLDGSRLPVLEGWSWPMGYYGCLQSHLRVLEQSLRSGDKHVLVLEDDACLVGGFAEAVAGFLAACPDDYDGLLLGGEHLREPGQVAPGVVRAVRAQRSHAYSARPAYQCALYTALARAHGSPDWFMQHVQPRFKIYCPAPFLVGQRGGASDVYAEPRHERDFWPEVNHLP